MTNDYTSMTTWADVAREEEAYWSRPRCASCGEDFGLKKITYPWGETDYFCEDCWEARNDED